MVVQMGHVGPAAGGEVVHADDRVPAAEQVVAEVGAEEASPAEDDDPGAHRRPIPV